MFACAFPFSSYPDLFRYGPGRGEGGVACGRCSRGRSRLLAATGADDPAFQIFDPAPRGHIVSEHLSRTSARTLSRWPTRGMESTVRARCSERPAVEVASQPLLDRQRAWAIPGTRARARRGFRDRGVSSLESDALRATVGENESDVSPGPETLQGEVSGVCGTSFGTGWSRHLDRMMDDSRGAAFPARPTASV